MKLALGLLIIAFSSSTAFGQDYLNCIFKIADNDVDCPFLGSCPQEILEESKVKLNLEVNEGDVLKGKILLKKVLLFPGTSDEKDNNITLFKTDNRHLPLKSKVDLTTYNLSSGLSYQVAKAGDSLDIKFESDIYELKMNLQGNGKLHDYVMTQDNAISVTCEKLNKSVFEDLKARKEALTRFNQEKKSSAASKQ